MEEGRGDRGVEMFGQHLHDGTTHEPVYSLENAVRVPCEYPSRTRSASTRLAHGVLPLPRGQG